MTSHYHAWRAGFTSTVLLALLGAGGVAAAPGSAPAVLVIAVPKNPSGTTAQAGNQLMDRLWSRLTPEGKVIVEVWNATDNVRITRIEPRGSRKEWERTRAEGVGNVRRFLDTARGTPASQGGDDLQAPAFLREFGSVIRNALPPGDVQLLLLGRAQHHDLRSPSFSMREGMLPTDDHILAPPEVSPYGTAGRTTSLAGTKLHVCHTEQAADWASEPARLGTSRFYALFVQAMGGHLGTFAALGDGCTGRFLAGIGSPETHTLRPTGKLVMYPAAHRPVEVSSPPPPPPPTAPPPSAPKPVPASPPRVEAMFQLPVCQKPPETLVVSMRIGIKWDANVDLDLHALAKPGAEWLYFARKEPADRSNGRFDHDWQTPPAGEDAYESVIYSKPLDLRSLQLAVNIYAGTNTGGTSFTLRIWMEAHACAWELRSRVPAPRGNRGQGNRSGPEWVSINPLDVVGMRP